MKTYTCIIFLTCALSSAVQAHTYYEAWSLAEFSGELHDQSLWEPNADPDGDNLDNLLEYALASDPLFADATVLPIAQRFNDQLSFAFSRDSAKADIVYRIEVSSDLQTWKRVPSEVTSAKKGIERRLVRFSSNRSQGYIRLRVVPALGATIQAAHLDSSLE